MTDDDGLQKAFRLGLWLKGAHSLADLVGGLLLYAVPHGAITALVTRLTSAELLEDPRDIVAATLRQAAQGFGADAQAFAAWYLFTHGLVKLVLVLAILTERRWAYPAFFAGMICFIAYQVHLMTLHFSIPLAGITLLDVVVLLLALHDHRVKRRQS